MFWRFRVSCKPIWNCHWYLIIGIHRYHTQLAHWTAGLPWSGWFNVSLAFLRRNGYQIDVMVCVKRSSKQGVYTWILYVTNTVIYVTYVTTHDHSDTGIHFNCVDSYIIQWHAPYVSLYSYEFVIWPDCFVGHSCPCGICPESGPLSLTCSISIMLGTLLMNDTHEWHRRCVPGRRVSPFC